MSVMKRNSTKPWGTVFPFYSILSFYITKSKYVNMEYTENRISS